MCFVAWLPSHPRFVRRPRCSASLACGLEAYARGSRGREACVRRRFVGSVSWSVTGFACIEKIGKFPSERRIWALAAIEAIKQTYESPRGFRLRGTDPNRG